MAIALSKFKTVSNMFCFNLQKQKRTVGTMVDIFYLKFYQDTNVHIVVASELIN